MGLRLTRQFDVKIEGERTRENLVVWYKGQCETLEEELRKTCEIVKDLR